MGDEYYSRLEGYVRRTDDWKFPLLAMSISMPGPGSGINNLGKSVKALRKGTEAIEHASEALGKAKQAKRMVRSGEKIVPNNPIDELASSSGPTSVRPLNPSTRFYVSPEGEILDAKTYARNSGFRKNVRDETWNDAVDPETGQVNDPLSGGAVMNKEEPWDMGHREGMEYWKERDNAINKWLDNRNYTTRKEFLDKINDPNRYRPELSESNRSHRAEDATNDFRE